MTPKEWRRAEAQRRVSRALDELQRAQDLLVRAMAALSPLRYGAPTQARIGKLRDRVHAEWYRTGELRQSSRIEMDRDPTAEELAAVAKGPTP